MADPAHLTDPLPRSISLVLVRHAETDWVAQGRFQGTADTHLSLRGLDEAHAVARRLAEPAAAPALPLPVGSPVAIWHSPLHRAATTAHAIAEERGESKLLIASSDLEELSAGQWEGLTQAEIEKRWPLELAAWRRDPAIASPVGGETNAHAVRRVRRVIREVVAGLDAAPSPGSVWGIVVSHDGVLRLATLMLLALPGGRRPAFPFPPAAVTILERLGDGWQLRVHGLRAG